MHECRERHGCRKRPPPDNSKCYSVRNDDSGRLLINTIMYTDDEIEKNALAKAKKLKETYANEATDKKIYLPESNPVTVYMAGSPGAGKTESSKRLLNAIKDISPGEIIRIDPDELRNFFEGYNGSNAHLFQHAVWTVVNRIIDKA